ncbi:ABC transporter permease [Actinoplanes italicus]|uniref:Peptide/nickel transport system permease protein n=1 Tax=Actinoplanes italicus TaxID=113567 RepID=A0A2T0KAV5_9ACTN|nr:ABC transporter permease [Actinoplanes italicus]PRX20323.1 peptide/nickel transport system permease protein [Actinoplanes italicus]GIE34146.1 ABC transporter permease [Actinoplanes italicus]
MSVKTDKIDRLSELSAVKQEEQGVSLWTEAFRRLRRSPSAIIGASILLIFVIVAIIGPWVAPYSPTDTIGIREGVVKSGQGIIPGASAEHWLGYDHQGRDLFSRMLVGARQTLLVGVISTLIGLTIGAIIGGIAGAAAGLGGRVGRWVDNVLMRFVDIMLALPSLLLAVSIAALLGASLTTVMIAVGLVSVPIFARLLRGAMLAQSGGDYVLAATSLGVTRRRIALTHIVPNSLAPVIVQATLTLATAIIEAAALSFLGLGNPDSSVPEWGVMLADAQSYLGIRPGLAIYPALGIIITALGFTLLGEAMREALDPKLRK